VPSTARKHFDDDISRAWGVHGQAVGVEPTNAPLAADLARCSVAFAVGALDAYLSDAFVDSLTRVLKACRQKGASLPAAYGKLEMPVGPLIAGYQQRENWGLRMSARALMEKDNMLQLGRLRELLNPALKPGGKLWDDVILDYIDLDRRRLTGIKAADYASLTGKPKQEAKRKAVAHLLKHIGEIVQRRHDIVHNCDRPKSATQSLTIPAAKKMLNDIQEFARILDDHINANRAH
jgi:hypothetical protein